MGGDLPLRGKVVRIEPGAFLRVSALGVEEQRQVRVSLVGLPENLLGDRYRVELALQRGPVKMCFAFRALPVCRGKDWMRFTVEKNRAKLTRFTVDHNNATSPR